MRIPTTRCEVSSTTSRPKPTCGSAGKPSPAYVTARRSPTYATPTRLSCCPTTRAGSSVGSPTGAAVRIWRASSSCCCTMTGPATCAIPHAAARLRSPPPQAASRTAGNSTMPDFTSDAPEGLDRNLTGPGQDDRERAYRRERARDLVVDVIEGVGEEHAHAEGIGVPAEPEIHGPGGNPLVVRVQVHPLHATGITDVAAHRDPRDDFVVGPQGDQVSGAEVEGSFGD